MNPLPSAFVEFDWQKKVRGLVFVMVWAAVTVVALDVWLNLLGALPFADLQRVFDATSERGLSSWIAVTQTGLIALTLWAMAGLNRRLGASSWRGWAALALFFSYLAFDDATRFHERVGSAFATSAGSEGWLGAFPSYYWQVLLGPFFAVAGALMAVFLWREFRTGRLRLLVTCAFGLLAVAIALDFVDGLNDDHPLNLYAQLSERPGADAQAWLLVEMSAYDAVVHLSRAIEESLEIVAMTLFWASFLLHMGASVPGLHLRWAPTRASADPPAEAAWVSRPTDEPVPRRGVPVA